MLVFSPTMSSILYARRLVSPVFVNTRPITTEAKINSTEGSMKSLKATFAGLIRKSACRMPIARLVTPIGTTSKTHQVPARRKTASAPLASLERAKCFPSGSIASGQGGE